QPFARAFGSAADMAQGVAQQTVPNGPKQDHPIADLPGQLQCLRATASYVNWDRLLEVDEPTVRIEKLDHAPSLTFLIGYGRATQEPAAHVHMGAQFCESGGGHPERPPGGVARTDAHNDPTWGQHVEGGKVTGSHWGNTGTGISNVGA